MGNVYVQSCGIYKVISHSYFHALSEKIAKNIIVMNTKEFIGFSLSCDESEN